VFFGTMVQFWFWFTGNELPPVEDAPDDSKGARFATPKEKAALRAESGMAFGHVDGSPLLLQNEKHVLIMASTRSGKGVSLIIPHLLRYPGSAFVLDPKGENAKATGRQRAALNDKVLYLDPFGISGKPKARFNPLSRFTPDNMEAESKALAAALVMGERGIRDHWTGSAQQLLAAVILHVVTSPAVLPEEKDLGTVRALLLKNINSVLELMLESDAADGLLARLASSFLQTPEKEFGSILSTAQRETEILDNPFIVASLAAAGPGEEVNFADWHKGTMSVFLCLSAPKFPVFNRWLRLVLTAALDEMTDSLNPPPVPVCFTLDELATLGHLQIVENAVGLSAGYGIQLVTVFQDVAQMRDLYKGRWSSFVGNAGVRAVFSLDDYETAHYWSQFMGGHLVETTNQQQDIYGMTKGQSKGEAMRPLRTTEQLMLEFAKDQMLVLPQGSRPIISDRVPYFHDPGLSGLWDDPRGDEAKKPEIPAPPVVAPDPNNWISLTKRQEERHPNMKKFLLQNQQSKDVKKNS
ncbi:type IV secretory system conjugative DNA transfer family protein, partial [Desulfovibrio aerotolerans]